MKATALVKTLHVEIGHGSQDVVFTELLELVGNSGHVSKLRIRIRRDTYKQQSHAEVERWDGAKWQNVEGLHYSKMQTPEGLHINGGRALTAHFAADRSALIAIAKVIV